MSTINVNEMLAGRQSTYGAFENHAKISQALKNVMFERSSWDRLKPDQREALEMINRYPLTGVGLGNYLVRLPEFGQSLKTVRGLQPVHNIFLLIASETGLVGLVICLWLLLLTFIRLFTNKDPGLTCRWLRTSLLVIVFLGLVDHYWLTLQSSQLLLAVIFGLSWSE